MSTASWVICYGILSAYCLAGSLMEHFAVISGWSAVDAASFPAVHKAQGNGVAVVYVIPKITLTIFVLVLVARRPAQVSMSLLVASLAALAVSWAATGAHEGFSRHRSPLRRRLGSRRSHDRSQRLRICPHGPGTLMLSRRGSGPPAWSTNLVSMLRRVRWRASREPETVGIRSRSENTRKMLSQHRGVLLCPFPLPLLLPWA